MPLSRLILTALLGPSVFILATMSALAAVLAQLGRFRPGFDILTHFAPFYLVGGFAAVALGLLFHGLFRRLTLAAGLAAALAAVLLMAHELLLSAGPQAGAGPTLKIVQLNVWQGEGGLTRAVDWLVSESPDVAVVEEADHRVRDAVVARTGWHVTGGRNDVMIFSRAAPLATLVPETDTVGPMNLVGVRLPTPLGPAAILGVHYPWPISSERAPATKVLTGIIKGLPRGSTILAGDFNSTPWSFERRRDDRDFGLIRRTRALFSWPARVLWPFLVLPIDHLYAGPAWATVAVRRGPDIGSDHYPVIVTLGPAQR